MNRVKVMVSANFSGDAINPGAMMRTINGVRSIPQTAATARRIDMRRMADLANKKAADSPSLVRYSVNIGTNAMVRDPSAKSLLSKFGILKATKKASEAIPAPKNPAMTTSLTKPKIRLNRVAPLTTPAAFVTCDFTCFLFTVSR